MTTQILPATLEGHQLDIIIIGSERWARSDQIGLALELAFPSRAIRKIFKRHEHEFNDTDTMVVQLPTKSGRQLIRLFSAKGAMKI